MYTLVNSYTVQLNDRLRGENNADFYLLAPHELDEDGEGEGEGDDGEYDPERRDLEEESRGSDRSVFNGLDGGRNISPSVRNAVHLVICDDISVV